MEEAQDSKSVKKEEPNIEEKITCAMRARVGHFKKQADSLTLEGVRRVLEKELGLEKFALDVHKRFIKQCLQECFDGAGDENISKTSEEIIHSTKEETPEFPEELQLQKEVKEPGSEDEEKMQGSPVLGLLGRDKTVQNKTEEAQDIKVEEVPSEDTIKKAIKKRASYFRANSDTVTMVKARRLLEEDLKLDKNALDSCKKFISEQLDKVLQSPEVSEPTNGVKNKRLKKNFPGKMIRKVSSKESSESMGSEDERSKKKITPKGKIQKSDGLKSRKRSAEETKTTSNKKKKVVEPVSDEGSDAKDSGNLSEDGHSQSSAEEPVKKKKEVPTPVVYGKRVEHLKSVIKSCGMSVPPTVYKRAKQAPESKREAYLIKELEEILDKEGLSTNPSEKEIKAVRKRKETTKELEGIDVSNIVSSSRRRSTYDFTFTTKPKVPVESKKDDEKKGTDDDEDEDEDDEDDDDDDGSNSEDTSEGFNEDVEEESD